MIEISHLVADGCSLTYCQGLEKPHVDGWPALLAKKIGVPVVNLALGGSGNDGIHRRQYEYFYRSNEYYKSNNITANPLHIIGLTFAGRREEFFKKYHKSMEGPRYFTLDLTPDFDYITKIIDSKDTSPESIAAYVEYGYFLNFDLTAAHFRKMETWASLINLYQNNKINYIIGDYIPTFDDNVEFISKARHKELHDFLYTDKQFYGKFCEVTNHLKPLPCGHDDLEAQKVLADYIYNKMLDQYGEIVVTPITNVYTLRHFYKHETLKRSIQYSDWYINS